MKFSTYLEEELQKQIPQLMAGYEGEVEAESLSEMEKQVQVMMQVVGNTLLAKWLEVQGGETPAKEEACGQCGGRGQYQRCREGMSITLLGRVYYQRAYYGCRDCRQGFYPLDERLGIAAGQMSEEVVQLAGLFGVEDAYGTGQALLQRATGLELSPNSIRKATQLMGQQVMNRERGLQERSECLEAQREQKRSPDKPQRLYGSMDGFMVLLEDGYHEMKAGAWWQTTTTRKGETKAQDIRYYADLVPAQDFADLVWTTGFERHADQAQELIFIADGAEWIWRIVQQHYPQAVQIVDWYHPCAYLSPAAQSIFQDPTAREAWIAQMKTHLWEGEVDAVIADCQFYLQPALKREDNPVQQALTYYQNNRQRMAYPTYRAKGYQIGSGTMESGCKQLGLARLKIAGARWRKPGARLVAKARAAFLSGHWDTLVSAHHSLSQVA